MTDADSLLEIGRLRAAMKRLAAPFPFHEPKVATQEDRAKMYFALYVLDGVDTKRAEEWAIKMTIEPPEKPK